jgi:hypothetical protein
MEDTYLSDMHVLSAFVRVGLKLEHTGYLHSYISSGAIRFRYLFGFRGYRSAGINRHLFEPTSLTL